MGTQSLPRCNVNTSCNSIAISVCNNIVVLNNLMRLLLHTSVVVRTIGRSLAAKGVLNVNLTIVHRHWYAYHRVFTHW